MFVCSKLLEICMQHWWNVGSQLRHSEIWYHKQDYFFIIYTEIFQKVNYDHLPVLETFHSLGMPASLLLSRVNVQKDSWASANDCRSPCPKKWWQNPSPPKTWLDVEPVFLTGGIYRIWLSICRQGKSVLKR